MRIFSDFVRRWRRGFEKSFSDGMWAALLAMSSTRALDGAMRGLDGQLAQLREHPPRPWHGIVGVLGLAVSLVLVLMPPRRVR